MPEVKAPSPCFWGFEAVLRLFGRSKGLGFCMRAGMHKARKHGKLFTFYLP